VAYEEAGLLVGDPEQLIFTPEWAAQHGFDDASVSASRAETLPRSSSTSRRLGRAW
jgi:hypothetical protein